MTKSSVQLHISVCSSLHAVCWLQANAFSVDAGAYQSPNLNSNKGAHCGTHKGADSSSHQGPDGRADGSSHQSPDGRANCGADHSSH